MAPGSAGIAPGRLLRLFPSATLPRPLLRSLFSYSGGSRGVADAGADGPAGTAARRPAIPLASSAPSTPFVSPWMRVNRRAGSPAIQKGGWRVSFTFRPADLPSRSDAMTPFPERARTAAPPKVTRRPPFPPRRRPKPKPARPGTRPSPPEAPAWSPGAEGGRLLSPRTNPAAASRRGRSRPPPN